MTFDLTSYLKEKKEFFETELSNWVLPKDQDPELLSESMHYSLFADGKRIRPILVFATAEALGTPCEDVMPIAVAMEMIHVFSLIHDDLPAMDDDDLRRGQPTNHKVYGEAVAILAGDALMAEAILPLTKISFEKFSADKIVEVIALIVQATGSQGMIGGQVIDLQSEGKTISLERLKKLHSLKTGALIKASVLAPTVLVGVGKNDFRALDRYATSIGLAFQIADDILDIEGGVDLGKDVGSDIANGKSTYPSLMGLDKAKTEAKLCLQQALDALSIFDHKATALRAIAAYIISRTK